MHFSPQFSLAVMQHQLRSAAGFANIAYPTACPVTLVSCSISACKLHKRRTGREQVKIFSNKSFAAYRGPSLSPKSCRPIIQFANIGSNQPVSCVLFCDPATRSCACRCSLSAGSTVSRLVTDEVTSAQLQALFSDGHELQSLELGYYVDAVSARGLAGLTHIHSMHLRVNSCASLQSVFTLTHLENLELTYCMRWEETLPQIPCSDFPYLVSLKVETQWDEPRHTFQYLSQLQNLKHLSLATATPHDFKFATLSRLTSLHMDQFSNANLEALQHLLRLRDLDLLGYPTDEDVHMLARLTTLTALQIESNSPEDVSCHLSSVIKLSSLEALQTMHCQVVDDGAHYMVTLIDKSTDAPEDAFMVISVPNSSFVLEVQML